MHAEVVFCTREKFEAISGVDAIHLVCNARHVLDLKKKKNIFSEMFTLQNLFLFLVFDFLNLTIFL